MARTPRRETRAPAGPGRGKPRSRAASRPQQATSTPHQTVEEPEGLSVPRASAGLSVTRRALALAAVVAILMVSYATTMKLYLEQRREMQAKKAEIAAAQERIDALAEDLERWEDPAYVKAQARDRLGWVVPGETSYVVLDAQGRPLAGSATIARDRTLGSADHMTWWQRSYDTVLTADQPAPQPTDGSILIDPSPTPTPTR